MFAVDGFVWEHGEETGHGCFGGIIEIWGVGLSMEFEVGDGFKWRTQFGRLHHCRRLIDSAGDGLQQPRGLMWLGYLLYEQGRKAENFWLVCREVDGSRANNRGWSGGLIRALLISYGCIEG